MARFRRAERLRKGRDYRRLAACGRRVQSDTFVVFLLRREITGAGGVRLGITVSGRVGGAVVRNRLKRLVREWFRQAKASLPGDLEVVVIARPGAAALDRAGVAGELSRLVEGAL